MTTFKTLLSLWNIFFSSIIIWGHHLHQFQHFEIRQGFPRKRRPYRASFMRNPVWGFNDFVYLYEDLEQLRFHSAVSLSKPWINAIEKGWRPRIFVKNATFCLASIRFGSIWFYLCIYSVLSGGYQTLAVQVTLCTNCKHTIILAGILEKIIWSDQLYFHIKRF